MLRATYSPEDNKLRLYSESRLDDETYKSLKSAGFKWAPKQAEVAGYDCLMVAPMWTPSREDLLLELCDDIEDEDYSPEERAADKAERLAGYRDRRADEATGRADRFDAGPSAFGHQNRGRAERQAARHDRLRVGAVSQWSKAEYWQQRTEGVISHALFKSSASVRRGRVLTLEAEQRKHNKDWDSAKNRYSKWEIVAAETDAEKATRMAVILAGNSMGWDDFKHPETGYETSLYSLLQPSQYRIETDRPITGQEAVRLYFEKYSDPSENEYYIRWAAHYELRLSYENAMLQQEGGSAAEVEMIPGGFVGRHQIHAVNKSPATGRVVSVKVWGEHPWRTNADGTPKMGLQSVNIERLGASIYREPTPEELADFNAKKQAAKKEQAAKAKANPKPSLINPTDTDAERLQMLWNAKAMALFKKHRCYGDYVPTAVKRVTQAQYSSLSKGSYSHFSIISVNENGQRPGNNDSSPSIVFTIRKGYGSGNFTGQADAVVVLTDKPQKPLPLKWEECFNALLEQQQVAH